MIYKFGQESMPFPPILCILKEVVQYGMVRPTQEALQKHFLLIKEDIKMTTASFPMRDLLVKLVDNFLIVVHLTLQLSDLFEDLIKFKSTLREILN